jgi:glycosyltransferase involved in cell wall biosynthesis
MSNKILLTVPAYNEENILEKNVNLILKYMGANFNNFKIVIANNGSTDKTNDIAKKLAKDNNEILLITTKKRGKGLAIKNSWLKFDADIYAYMDADLSTSLRDFSKLINAIKEGNDISIGSRYLKKSVVKRGLNRAIFSKLYNQLLALLFKTNVKDMQCGFKAVNEDIIKKHIPRIKDDSWFFDTELVIMAENQGYTIKEIPVSWKSNPESKLKIIKVGFECFGKSLNLKKKL